MESGRPMPRSMALDPAIFATFPGAVLLVQRDGRAEPLNKGGAGVIERLRPGEWEAAGMQIAACQTASLEALALDRVVEAQLLPLNDRAVLVIIQEQALDTSLRDALIESRQRFKSLVEIVSDFAWETDVEGAFIFVSPQGALGWSAAELLGRRASEYLIDASDAQIQVFRTDGPIADLDLWFRRSDGGAACLNVSAVPVFSREGKLQGARGVCRDLTADRARDEALARARLRDRLMAHLVRTMRDEIEPQQALSAAVSAASLAAGASGGAVLRRRVEQRAEVAARWGEMVSPATLTAVEEHLVGAAELNWIEGGHHLCGLSTRYRGATNGALVLWRAKVDGPFSEADRAIITDVADQLGIAIAQVVHHERILHLSRTDPLTGLLNRRAFVDELERRLSTTQAQRRAGALLYLDLDNFKLVNDRGGHGAGDDALRAFARILRENTRHGDLAARLGGDEFVIWIEGIGADAGLARGQSILRAFEGLTGLTGDSRRPLSVSMGLAAYNPAAGETPAALLARADQAMYDAKAAGKARICASAAGSVAEVLPA